AAAEVTGKDLDESQKNKGHPDSAKSDPGLQPIVVDLSCPILIGFGEIKLVEWGEGLWAAAQDRKVVGHAPGVLIDFGATPHLIVDQCSEPAGQFSPFEVSGQTKRRQEKARNGQQQPP